MPFPAQARNRIQVMRVGEHFLSGIQAGEEGGLLPGTCYMGLLLPRGGHSGHLSASYRGIPTIWMATHTDSAGQATSSPQ